MNLAQRLNDLARQKAEEEEAALMSDFDFPVETTRKHRVAITSRRQQEEFAEEEEDEEMEQDDEIPTETFNSQSTELLTVHSLYLLHIRFLEVYLQ